MKKIVFVLLVLSTTNAFSHSGRTNASGCHNSSVYGYHCHNSGTTTTTPIYTPPVVDTPVTPIYTPPVYVPPTYTPPEFNDVVIEETRNFELDYEGFTVWLDCDKRGATKFRYNAQRDTGSFPRVENFAFDKNVPAECQQTSAKAYGKSYDRGHLVPANHLDYSKKAIAESNYMTNILPQASSMNRGVWLATEEIIECLRDKEELLIIGGVIWGDNKKDDYFLKSHGVETPDSFYKVVIKGDGDAIAWNIPNKSTSTRKKLDDFLVSVLEIERLTGERMPVSNSSRIYKKEKSWTIPKNCNKG